MPKRSAEDSSDSSSVKKERKEVSTMYNKIATFENAKAVTDNPPLDILLNAMKDGLKKPEKGKAVVYWMRMDDIRSMKSFTIACVLTTNSLL